MYTLVYFLFFDWPGPLLRELVGQDFYESPACGRESKVHLAVRPRGLPHFPTLHALRRAFRRTLLLQLLSVSRERGFCALIIAKLKKIDAKREESTFSPRCLYVGYKLIKEFFRESFDKNC